MSDFDAAFWDRRYTEHGSVWGGAPNRWVEQEVAELPAGRALDLACGEGRNAVWLARRGWRVVAVDFSVVALDKGRALEGAAGGIEWVHADATSFEPAEHVDLALLCYFQLEATARREAVRHAAAALRPGGVLLVVAHDSRNLTDGTGGPQDPSRLYTAQDVAADLDGCGLQIERAGEVFRPVEGADRPAIDCLLRASRPLA